MQRQRRQLLLPKGLMYYPHLVDFLVEGEALAHDKGVGEQTECSNANVGTRQNGAIPNRHLGVADRTEEIVVRGVEMLGHFTQFFTTLFASSFAVQYAMNFEKFNG